MHGFHPLSVRRRSASVMMVSDRPGERGCIRRRAAPSESSAFRTKVRRLYSQEAFSESRVARPQS